MQIKAVEQALGSKIDRIKIEFSGLPKSEIRRRIFTRFSDDETLVNNSEWRKNEASS